MNKQGQSIWHRSTLMRATRKFCTKRAIQFASIILAVAAVAIVCFYAEEDWRGNRAWKTYLSQSGIAPHQLDLRTYIPKPVPDDKNFGAIPAVKQWFATKWQDNPLELDHFSKVPDLMIQSFQDVEKQKHLQLVDLAAWQTALKGKTKRNDVSAREKKGSEAKPLNRGEAAYAVLAALADDEMIFQPLRAVTNFNESVYPVKYTLDDPWNISVPHAANIQKISTRLNLKACAELAVGDSDKALNNLTLIFCLANSLTNESLVISYLIRAKCVRMTIQPIWEGIAAHQWSDSQLQQIETQLLQFDFLIGLERSLKMERAEGVLTVDLTKSKGVRYLSGILYQEPSVFGGVLGRVVDFMIPSGWFALEKVNYCRSFDLLFANTFDPVTNTASPVQADANFKSLNQNFGATSTPIGYILHHQTIARSFLTPLPKVLFRGVISQTAANEAALACALERYRLAHSNYPVSLQSLAPDWIPALPHDVIGGQSYHYYSSDSKNYTLYSIGWNAKDDGGMPGESVFGVNGDWVWKNSH